jgi:subtilase family serine protease
VIGSWVNISATVRNGGDISANDVLVSFYAQSTAPGAPELLLSEQTIALIGVGGSGVAKASWLPGLAGNYNIRIAIDGVTSLTFVQNVLNYADLTPSNILFTPGSPVVVNTDVKVEAVISNIGQITAYNLVVRFYVGEAGTGTLIGETIVSSIGSGENKVVSVTWKANISTA